MLSDAQLFKINGSTTDVSPISDIFNQTSISK